MKSLQSLQFITFSFILSLFTSSVVSENFQDILNYKNIYLRPFSIDPYLENNFLNLLLREPFFSYVGSLVHSISPDFFGIRLIVFFSTFLLSISVSLLLKNNFYSFIFLTSPFAFTLYLTHIRQGLAISLFIFACLVSNKYLKVLLSFLAFATHISILFAIFVLFFSEYYSFKTRANFYQPFLPFIFALTLALSAKNLFYFLPLRQTASFILSQSFSSGFLFVFYLYVLILFIVSGIFRSSYFAFSGISFYLGMYFLTGYSARFLIVFLPFIFLAFIPAKKLYFHLFASSFLMLSVIVWAYRASFPYFGFSV